jgi:two-component system, NarL family, response regulator NreC
MTTRILIADDHGVLRDGLAVLLDAEPGMRVVGEASTSEEAVRLAETLQPDLILMDISMPEQGGIEATRRIHERLPKILVLILTVHEDISLVREAIRAGAAGYILKRAVKTELLGAIQSVLRGELYVHPSMTRSLLAGSQPDDGPPGGPQSKLQGEPRRSPAGGSPAAPESLTAREVEILRLLVRGNTNSQIAEMLSVSVRTVEYHRANLTGKLNLHSRVDLIRYAAENKII